MHDSKFNGHDYPLGHSEHEQQRLMNQGRFFGDLTERLFRDAGIGPGKCVLDLGCGVGDVSLIAASLVGPAGSVIGIDRAPEALETATRRVRQAGLTNVRFIQHDLNNLEALAFDAPLDAVIGRMVLMYLPQPARVLRGLRRWIRKGGVVAMQEMDVHSPKAEPRCPLYEVTSARLLQTMLRAGVDTMTAMKLGQIFVQAGLPTPQMLYSARAERGRDSWAYDAVAGITRTLLPMMERFSVASAAEIDIDTLAARLREEAVGLDATLVAPPFMSAWCRIQ